MTIRQQTFGTTKDDRQVTLYTVTNVKGNYVNFLDYGATIQTLVIFDRSHSPIDVALGYDTIEEYENGRDYFGAFIGRVANRLERARFDLGPKTYTLAVNDRGKNHLHGGLKGFDKQMYQAEILDDGIRFFRTSPDMEEGYPGNLRVSVTYRFSDDDVLSIHYEAQADQATPVNLTNHSYFNLNGQGSGSIENHTLRILADFYTENTGEGFPNGNIVSVADSPFDFRTPKTIGRDIGADNIQLKEASGYDHNYIPNGRGFRKIAEASGEGSGIKMEVWSDMPGVQLYTGNAIGEQTGKTGVRYRARCGFALETQYYPNAMMKTHFPSIILPSEDLYESDTEYRFSFM